MWQLAVEDDDSNAPETWPCLSEDFIVKFENKSVVKTNVSCVKEEGIIPSLKTCTMYVQCLERKNCHSMRV